MLKLPRICITAVIAGLVGTTVACGGLDGISQRGIECERADHIVLIGDQHVDQPQMASQPKQILAERTQVAGELKTVEPQEAMRLADELPEVQELARRSPRCIHNDTIYWPGQVYPVGDGCNVCLCNEDGDSTCTLVDC